MLLNDWIHRGYKAIEILAPKEVKIFVYNFLVIQYHEIQSVLAQMRNTVTNSKLMFTFVH